MEVSKSSVSSRNANFGMALRLSQGINASDLRKYVENESIVQNESKAIKGLKNVIKKQVKNNHFDIFFVRNNTGDEFQLRPITSRANELLKDVQSKGQEGLYDDKVTKIQGKLTEMANNPAKGIFGKFSQSVKTIFYDFKMKMVLRDSKNILPDSLRIADSRATELEKIILKNDKIDSEISKELLKNPNYESLY